jgi:hypothetical protein
VRALLAALAAFVVAMGVGAAVSCSGDKPREICFNGIDDDGNGLIDCADPDCAGKDGCPVIDYGSCKRCGMACTAQQDCIDSDWSSEQPLPMCMGGKCYSLNQRVAERLTLDMSAYAGIDVVRSEATHWIHNVDRNGAAVTCASLKSLVQPDAGALVIEESGQFDVYGFDSEPVQSTPAMLTFPFVNTATTDAGYLIWIEVWTASRNSNPPHEPTGKRLNPGCVESGATVAPIVASDDCTGDGGTCRTINYAMPAPM